MKIKAVSFDIGNTLVNYSNPLNWKSMYTPALRRVMEQCGLGVTDEMLGRAAAILARYNTRENPREKEVTADVVFGEILDAWDTGHAFLGKAKAVFYSFFQADAVCYEDAPETLGRLKDRGIKIGVLTDVAYGMENLLSLRDIAPIRKYIDLALTSVDIGYRKPNKAGYLKLLDSFRLLPPEMIYVGDEEKDIAGANNLGVVSVLVSRSGGVPDFGQKHTVFKLVDICSLI